MSTEPPEKSPRESKSRDWPTLVLGLAILYLVLFFPVALILEAKPEVLAGAIGVLVTTFGGVVGVKAMHK
jgi:hypothetical protein